MHDGRVQGAPRRPGGFLAIPALVAPVAICGIPGHTGSGTQLAAEVAVLVLVVGVVGFESTASVGLVAVAASLLSLNGFAEDAYGQLGWHPAVDLRAATVLCAVLVLACAARRGVDRARPEPPAESHVRAMTTTTPAGAPSAHTRLDTPSAAGPPRGPFPDPRKPPRPEDGSR